MAYASAFNSTVVFNVYVFHVILSQYGSILRISIFYLITHSKMES